MPNKDQRIEKCPFCGGEAVLVSYEVDAHTAHCSICKAETGLWENKEKALKAWNRRV